MDNRLRKLELQWKQEPTDTNAHARYLSALLRIGTLNIDRIFAAALWGHKGARAMLEGDAVKKDAIIYNGRRISTIETRDIIRGSEHLSSDATRRIALGIIKLCFDHLVVIEKSSRQRALMPNEPETTPFDEGYSPANVDLGTVVVYAEAYLSGNTTSDEVWKVLRKINEFNTYRIGYSWLRRERQQSLERIIYNCCIDIVAAGACHKIPLAAVAWFTDEQILEAVRAELYPWTLGDAR